MIKTVVRANNYMDSIFLMNASKEVMQVKGVKDAVLIMGTEMNKTVLADFGGLTDEAKSAGTNDLIISLDIEDESLVNEVISCLDRILNKKEKHIEKQEFSYQSFKKALSAMPEANLAVISVPGEYAAQEAMTALEHNMNVFIFSDNVPLEDEIELKRVGREKGLLVMGPGCGTSVINNISIGLMSKVRRGSIGIVGASGSGIHEIAVLVHRYGFGISQAIGTGGRDLSREIGGSTMLQGIEYLEQDKNTKVIVLVSKPPHPETTKKIIEKIKHCNKPVVVFFLGGDPQQVTDAGAFSAATLEEAAKIAVDLVQGKGIENTDYVCYCKNELAEFAAKEKAKLKPEQKYMRGLFCGGTHSEEAVLLLQDFVPDLHSNLRFGKVNILADSYVSMGNSLVDMGSEEFTKGKPHPVMDPSILKDRLMMEGSDPEVAVILFDLLFGHGVHKDPVGTIEETLAAIRDKAKAEGRYISMVASLCGTDLDPQDVNSQRKRLEALGVNILPSNCKAAILSGLIVS
ncbi:MAG: acyl-CoA synthetase FdrA [Acetivibrionales bacterium]